MQGFSFLHGFRAIAVLVFVEGLVLAPAHAVEPDAPEELFTPVQAIAIGVRKSLEKQPRRLSDGAMSDRKALSDFYAANDNQPLWVTLDGGLTDKAFKVIDEIKRADDWGLKASQFRLPDEDIANEGDALPQAHLIRLERKMSLNVLKYARFARGGRIPDPAKNLSSYLDRKPQYKDPVKVLEEISITSQPDAYLRDLHPKHDQFVKLRQALLDLRGGKEQDDGVVRLPLSGPMLRRGNVHPHVALLRTRLEVPTPELDPDQGIDPEIAEQVFDDALYQAVRAFQRDNGLRADGLVGPSTRRALNGDTGAPLSEALLIANMEQWRWMPEDLGEAHVAVNLPKYEISVIENGEVLHSAKIIIGKTNNQTPVFSDKLEKVVFHPYWHVPNSIKVREIWPSLARGGSVLRRQGLRIRRNGRSINPHRVDWSRADIRNYEVFQPPGRHNVLGKVKFLFPNKHQVYFHDTPKKKLFSARKRTFSHGCMRVQNPLKLAEVILNVDKNWGREEVDDLIENGPENNEIPVEKAIKVHTTYFTAHVEDDGTVTTFADVYGHEKRIKLALAGKHNLIARHRDHLLPVKYDRRVYANYGNDFESVGDLLNSIFGGF